MYRHLIFIITIAACTTETYPTTKTATTADVLWICSTIESCNGDTTNRLHELCARPTPEDVLVAGDAAAHDWEVIWDSACETAQGDLDGDQRTCLNAQNEPANSYCRAQCWPQYEPCAP